MTKIPLKLPIIISPDQTLNTADKLSHSECMADDCLFAVFSSTIVKSVVNEVKNLILCTEFNLVIKKNLKSLTF